METRTQTSSPSIHPSLLLLKPIHTFVAFVTLPFEYTSKRLNQIGVTKCQRSCNFVLDYWTKNNSGLSKKEKNKNGERANDISHHQLLYNLWRFHTAQDIQFIHFHYIIGFLIHVPVWIRLFHECDDDDSEDDDDVHDEIPHRLVEENVARASSSVYDIHAHMATVSQCLYIYVHCVYNIKWEKKCNRFQFHRQ